MHDLPLALRRSHDLVPVPPRGPQFESATAEVLGRYHPIAQRGTLYTLSGLVVVSILFMCVFKIERVVSAPGRLLPITGTFTVQPMEKAIINRVLVSVGDQVRKGQVLATCDPTFATADLTQLQQKIASLQAQVRRMEAEQAGEELPAVNKNSYDLMQASIFRQRRIEFTSGVADFDQRIISTEAMIAGLKQKIVDDKTRLQIARKMEKMNSELAQNGYVSQMDLLNAQTARVGLSSDLGQSESSLASNLHQLESLKEQRKQFVDKWQGDNLDSLAAAKDALDAAQQDLAKAQKVSELVNLVAPEDAIVVKVPNLSAGAIATDAQPLFSLVPVHAPLEVAAQIDSQDVGFIGVGDKVIIKFDAYKFLEHGTGVGIVKTISQDSFTEASTQDAMSSTLGGAGMAARTPYFDTRIKLTDVKLHDVPKNFRMTPGMTVQADIVVGKRTIAWYLFGGLLRSGSEAMREP